MIAMLQGEKPMDTVAMLAPCAWHHLQGLEDGADRGAAPAKIGHLGIQKNGEFHHEKMGQRWV